MLEQCPGCNQNYDGIFNHKMAKNLLKKYKRRGVRKSSRQLVNKLKEYHWKGASLLDIGGGIGVLFFELVPKGMERVLNIDISQAFNTVFQQEAKDRGVEKRIAFKVGDFLNFKDELGTYDLVTLDKVICCYPDYKGLVEHSVQKAARFYAYVIPRDTWWVKVVHAIGQGLMDLFQQKFRTYIHPSQAIEHIVLGHGFKKIYEVPHREWMTVVYEKIT